MAPQSPAILKGPIFPFRYRSFTINFRRYFQLRFAYCVHCYQLSLDKSCTDFHFVLPSRSTGSLHPKLLEMFTSCLKGNLPHMATIGTAIMIYYLPMLLDFIALKEFGKYNLNIQIVLPMGALCTPEIFEKIVDGFRKHGFDEPEVFSAYGSTELGREQRFTIDHNNTT